MDSFVVRIYRYEQDKGDRLLGTVERVGKDSKEAFTCVDELWQILNVGRESRTGRRGSGRTGRPRTKTAG